MAYPLTETGPVVRGNLFRQRQQEQQKKMEAVKSSPIVNNAQQQVEAAGILSPAVTTPTAPVAAPVQHQQRQQTMPASVNPASSTDGADYINSLLTTPKQEEELRRASINRQRILALGDVGRHIANLVTTVNQATPQQFNSPVQEEEQRYLRDKAIRDQNNMRYYSYQQAKAAQDAKQKQWEADYGLKVADAARKAGFTEAQIKNMQDRLAQQKAYQDANIALGQRRADDAKAAAEARQRESERHNKRIEGISAMNAKTNRDRATAYINKLNSGGNASSLPLKTPNGSIYAPGKSIPQAQMNQLYKEAVTNGYIAQSDFQRKMAEAGFGKADPDYVRNQLVAEAMMEHGELADFARDNYGWKYGAGGGSAPSIGWDEEEELSIGW